MEFCRKPRNANSSQMPAKINEVATTANPVGVTLSPERSWLDCSTAVLSPKTATSRFEAAMFIKISKTPKAKPTATDFGLAPIFMKVPMLMRFSSRYVSGTASISSSPMMRVGSSPNVN